MREQIPVYLLAFIFGSVWGSFFWTLALRMVSESFNGRRLSILTESSRCPACETRVNPLHLIPFFGYFLSGRRCRKCSIRISRLYPATELLSGLLCCVTVSSCGVSFRALCIFLLLSISLVISYVDFKKMIVPDILSSLCALLAIYPVYLSGEWKSSLIGSAVLGGFFFLIILVFPGGFGGGDMKFAAALGFFAGFDLSIIILEIALITGSVFGVGYAFASGRGFRIRIPFAPFLTIGLFAAVFFGREILLLYYQTF